MKKIGACMIVKNEARIILRCLHSMLPLIDFVLVEDTGSTDGTQKIIRDFMAEKGLPGDVFDEPWQDFSHNRTVALARLRQYPEIDYALLIDADDWIEYDEGFDPAAFKAALDVEIYDCWLRTGLVHYTRAFLCSNHHEFIYRGVLHEYVVRPDGTRFGRANGLTIHSTRDGARGADPEKYKKDVAVLEAGLLTETDPALLARYVFYLAQSYRDAGEPEKALEHYLKRSKLGFWQEEVFVALHLAGELMERLDRPDVEILGTYLKGYEAVPGRAETLHAAARYCRATQRHHQGYMIGKHALTIPQPSDGLFMSPWVYEYGLLDDFSINAYWIGAYREALEAGNKLLQENKFPPEMRERIEQNRNFARGKFDEQMAKPAPPTPAVGFIEPVGGFGALPGWTPDRPSGGTELMMAALTEHCGDAFASVDLRLNLFNPAELSGKPLVLWMHHDIDQNAVQWCHDRAWTSRVHTFVFVSQWQQERYIRTFGLPPERCVVLRNATPADGRIRPWKSRSEPWQLAYVATPYRGLGVLLDAWRQLDPPYAQLHVWSSMKLYGPDFDDGPFRDMLDQVAAATNIVYHGITPNDRLRTALKDIDFLAYPCTFPETSCLSVIEAMAAGCRIVCPALGALPETTAGFGRVYSWNADPFQHARDFAATLADELANPWQGHIERAEAQQNYCRSIYDWTIRAAEWRRLIARIIA